MGREEYVVEHIKGQMPRYLSLVYEKVAIETVLQSLPRYSGGNIRKYQEGSKDYSATHAGAFFVSG